MARVDRRHTTKLEGPDKDAAPETRGPGEIDRDRVLYSDALRRLGGVTQVAGPNENHQFHNRYSHTLKVAQVAQRLAQRLVRQNPTLADRLDPDVGLE